MNIRFAEESDIETLSIYDKHIRVTELKSAVSLGRVIVAEDNGTFIGCLRWNLFWDNTPFMNLLFLPGYKLVMTSSLSNETAQHFYRKLDYVDSGALLLPGEPLEIIFTKKI